MLKININNNTPHIEKSAALKKCMISAFKPQPNQINLKIKLSVGLVSSSPQDIHSIDNSVTYMT